MLDWQDGLKLRAADLWMDSRRPRPACFISHAHSDHLGEHTRAFATQETAILSQGRVGLEDIVVAPLRQVFDFDPQLRLTFLPAGHVLGSSMLYAQCADGASLLYTGDFKLRDSLTAPLAEPCCADVLVMESTFGLPIFRFPPWQVVAAQLIELVSGALRAGRQPIVMGYSLGKSQEISRIITDAGLPVTEHGAVANVSRVYEQFGVRLGVRRRYRLEDFAGPKALDLAERGVLIAPPQVARTTFVTRFENPLRIMMSGWGMLKNAHYRYGVDHVLPLSDHADFDELMRLVEMVNPRQIYTHHGYPEFVDHLKLRGWNAKLARPPAQLELFD